MKRPTMIDLCRSEWLQPRFQIGAPRYEKNLPDALAKKILELPRAKSLRVCPTEPRAESPRVCSPTLERAESPRAESPRAKSSTIEFGEPSVRFDMSHLPSLPPQTCTFHSRNLCRCGRRCKNPGHSQGAPGCRSKELVKGSSLCVQCICILQPEIPPRGDSDVRAGRWTFLWVVQVDVRSWYRPESC